VNQPLLAQIGRGLGLRQETAGALSIEDVANILAIDNLGFPFLNQSLIGNLEPIEGDYVGLARGAMKGDSIVFSCIALRAKILSEARFAFRDIQDDGRPGPLSTGPELDILRTPWSGATTGELIARAEVYTAIGGNFYAARRPNGTIRALRPDWTYMVIGIVDGDPETDDPWSIDAEIVGFQYHEGGPMLGREPLSLLADEVAHFAPMPDPEARFRGMSWLTPVVREIEADKSMTKHKLAFLEHGGTSNMVMKVNEPDLAKFQQWVKAFKAEHDGVSKRYKTLFLQPGVEADVIGSNLQEIDFKNVQGAGESRIAAAAGIHPALGGFSEGLQGSALNRGNFAEIRRNFGDMHAMPWWRELCGSLSKIVAVPDGKELWYDARDVAFLAPGQVDAATADKDRAETMSTMFMAGWVPESIIEWLRTGDISTLEHTGAPSVQLQPAPGQAAITLHATRDVAAIVQLVDAGWQIVADSPVESSQNGHSDRLPVLAKEKS
jgi:hypothetical protein